jgi:DNA (cytosine-5)-methyltransferase 1
MFSGIGGPELAAEWCGWENISHTEWNPFGRNVLHYYWPQADSHEDATKTDYTIYRGRVNVLSAGFPCQGFSLAGKRLGTDDDRYHWPTVRRAYNECRPDWVVFENVTGLLSMEDKQGVWRDVFAKVEGGKVIRTAECDYYEKVYTRQAKMLIGTILEDIENDGYRPQLFVLPAASVEAPHKRERIFIVAHANSNGPHGAKDGQSVGKGAGSNTPGQAATCKPTRYPFQGAGPATDTIGIGNVYKRSRKRKLCNQIRYGAPEKCGRQQQPTGISGIGNENATNAIRTGRQKQYAAWKPKEPRYSGGGNFGDSGNNWANFPTQSPVCDGNDGVSAGLDFETVFEGYTKPFTWAKWRNESIKAGGNAIVPQVMYQIFKTIDEVAAMMGKSDGK